MNLEKLKKLLESGAITQEEFDAMANNLKPEDPSADPLEDDQSKNDPLAEDLEAKIAKAVQTAVDRATNKLGNENKQLKETLEKTRKEKMTAEELRQVELQEKEQELLDKERQVKEKENRMYAIKALKKAALDDGSEDALDLVDFVLADDEATIDARVKSLSALINSRVKREVEKTFRENGREPGKGNAGSGKENPWSKEKWNLTRQMELELRDPELAKTLKANAGQ